MDKMQKPPHILLMTPPKTKKKSKTTKDERSIYNQTN